jgi:riboflavin biosynthesis pyrimidine reductase
VRALLPAPETGLADAELAARWEFPDTLPWIRGSMVATLDGAVTGHDGTSRSIASPTDARVFSFLRSSADVILVGAGTLRDEDYRPSRLPLAIVSRSGTLPRTLKLFRERTDTTPRSLLLTTQGGAEPASAELGDLLDVVPCGFGQVDLGEARAALVARGLTRIHCEGGPALLSALAEANLLDELLLSVVPTLLGASPDRHILSVPGGLGWRMRITQVLEEEGTVLLRAVRSA